MAKKMEGNEDQKRQAARDAREEGKSASEIGATTGASKQRQEAQGNMTHQQRIDLEREGKQDQIGENTPEARPGARDAYTVDHEKYPRL
ncbi:MAG TPA: hypothetical protein VF665_22510 [Longimicrobium sp.]|jgi:hypothetical protein|uniref:hypothetical protein n=1 Tax=Longimicrobium sp. TaxID=2029185 RepID=UPI002ED9B74B